MLGVYGSAYAEERIALVVGNGNYSGVTRLANPASDARLISDKLEELGFSVTMITDAGLAELKQGVAEFGRRLRAGGKESTGLFYFAGHGVQSFGENYLLPVDTRVTNAADLALVAMEANSILRQMFSASNRTNIIILDACRNNPFENIPDFRDNGLAEMKAPTGTFLAYATAPGTVALDGKGANSPFTAALVEEMSVPGRPIEQVFKQVRVRVLEESAGAQTPWDTSSLTSEFVFTPEVELSEEEEAERSMWESVTRTRDMVQVTLFLKAYPESAYQDEARSLLAALINEMGASKTAGESAPAAGSDKSAAKPAAPDDREKALFSRAQSSGEKADFEAYVSAYPDGAYTELVLSELAALKEKNAHSQGVPSSNTQQQTASTEVAAIGHRGGAVTYQSPIAFGLDEIRGKSIEEVFQTSPSFPPIEGLPDAVWLGKECSGCHNWSREDLCGQGRIYAEVDEKTLTGKEHPHGGGFRTHLGKWAEDGCR